MIKKKALIIFLRNPELGKVKTRLASTVGDQEALLIYKRLVKYTLDVVRQTGIHPYLFYYPEIASDHNLSLSNSSRYIQVGSDLGERMLNAFEIALNDFDQAIILGTDCPYINHKLIDLAFLKLEKTDMVAGPATDGGYYLLGLKKVHRSLFENMEWSTDSVLKETLERAEGMELKYTLLKTLSDIDYEEDWLDYQKWLRENS